MSVVVGGGGSQAAAEPDQQDQTVARGHRPSPVEVVQDHYIVTLNKHNVRTDNVGATASDLVRAYGGRVMRTYAKAHFGYAVTMSAAEAKRLAGDRSVEAVHPAHRFTASDAQPAPSWGLDRIDQVASFPLDGQYNPPNAASSVTAYVIDTGIRYTHQDFGGRAAFGFDAFGGDGSDCANHGTAVAGVLGGGIYGVAKGVRLVSVRVLDCAGEGTTADILAGLDWIATHPATGRAVANMSLGGPADAPVDTAVNNLISSGVPVVVAAGNANAFTCDFSPAGVAPAITVGASDSDDMRASFSNWGSCNDLFAPGVNIASPTNGSDDGIGAFEGTSLSAPHVSGVAAMLLDADPTMTPAQILRKLVMNTNKTQRILTIANSNPPTAPVPPGTWHSLPFGTLPGAAVSRVAMVSNGAQVDAFVATAAPGRPIFHAMREEGTSNWTPWENLGGTTVGNPTALWTSFRLELWVTGADGAAWHRYWNGDFWSNWESLGGSVANADLVVVSPEPGTLDVFAISSVDANVWWRNLDGYAWTPWMSFGGPSSKRNFSVVVDPFTGADYVFAQGPDGALYYKYFDARTIPALWTPLGGTLRWDIKGVATSDGQMEVFVPGVDKAVWHRRWDRTSWSGWQSLGGVVSGDGVEAVATDAGIVDTFARSVDSRVYQRRLQNGTWSPWTLVAPDLSAGIPTATGVLTYLLALAFPRPTGGVFATQWF